MGCRRICDSAFYNAASVHALSKAFRRIVEAGPDWKVDGVVRWRRADLKRVIAERFGVHYHERYVGKPLKKLGFSHMSARPRHPAQDERIVEAF
jgi:transposase